MSSEVPVYNADPNAKKKGQAVKKEKVEKIWNKGRCIIAKPGEAPKPATKVPTKEDGVHTGNKVGDYIVYH